MQEKETTLEDLKKSIDELNLTIKRSTNMILYAISAQSAGKVFRYDYKELKDD